MTDRSNTPIVVVVVAVVGLLATVGSAAFGGYWGNKSVEREVESQRAAQIQDQRREVYDDYLRAVGKLCQVVYTTGEEGNEVAPAAFEVLNQAGRVRLIAGPTLEDVVSKGNDAILSDDLTAGTCGGPDSLRRFYDEFIDAAQADLE